MPPAPRQRITAVIGPPGGESMAGVEAGDRMVKAADYAGPAIGGTDIRVWGGLAAVQ